MFHQSYRGSTIFKTMYLSHKPPLILKFPKNYPYPKNKHPYDAFLIDENNFTEFFGVNMLRGGGGSLETYLKLDHLFWDTPFS